MMTGKFQNKYRIPSARATWWDYGRNAAYFVTICLLAGNSATFSIRQIGFIHRDAKSYPWYYYH